MSGLSLRASSKFGRLHMMLEIEPAYARGLLEFLWDSVSEEGDDVIGDAFDVEYRCGWQGEPGKLCKSLAACGGWKAGFIEEVPDQPGIYRLHDLVLNVPKAVVRKWISHREREEQGRTLSEVRAAAARKRWAKEKGIADPESFESKVVEMEEAKLTAKENASTRVAIDANACKTMQTDANCIDLHRCTPAAITASNVAPAVAAPIRATAVRSIVVAQPVGVSSATNSLAQNVSATPPIDQVALPPKPVVPSDTARPAETAVPRSQRFELRNMQDALLDAVDTLTSENASRGLRLGA